MLGVFNIFGFLYILHLVFRGYFPQCFNHLKAALYSYCVKLGGGGAIKILLYVRRICPLSKIAHELEQHYSFSLCLETSLDTLLLG